MESDICDEGNFCESVAKILSIILTCIFISRSSKKSCRKIRFIASDGKLYLGNDLMMNNYLNFSVVFLNSEFGHA